MPCHAACSYRRAILLWEFLQSLKDGFALKDKPAWGWAAPRGEPVVFVPLQAVFQPFCNSNSLAFKRDLVMSTDLSGMCCL